jgi:hypothetical protein
MKKLSIRCLVAVVAALALVGVNYVPKAWGSMFGEENATLAQILIQTLNATEELRKLNDAAHNTAMVMDDMRNTYQQVNAGIDELRSYSFDSFLDDFKKDVYHQYPGIGELAGASERLKRWDEDTHTRSPFTAYEAISAVAGDVAPLLRQRIATGQVNVDEELILAGEGAGALAIATTAEEATIAFDRETMALTRMVQTANPGASEQVSARAMVLLAAQNSHIIRLLSRTVRLEGVDRALEYGARMQGRAGMQDFATQSVGFMEQATDEPALMNFDELE